MRKKVVWLPYDFDTAIGINNEGALTFSYNLEDTDKTESGADVYNGQNSVMWNNLRDAFGDELMAMYKQLRSDGVLSYEVVEKMFEEHQEKWPEAIFNEDAAFKYIMPLTNPEDGKPTGAYLSMLQGSKADQRKWWLYNRFRYIDSKYNAGDALSDVIQLRGYAKADITVTPYADIYPSVKYGSYLVQKRGARGVESTLVCPLDNVNDTEIYIYSASQLSSVGDLSGLMVGFADFSMGTKLQNLKIGDGSSAFENKNLNELYVGTNTLLKTLDVRNCTALGTGDMRTVDVSGCSNIEELYFDNTKIQGLTLPDGGVIRKLHLPSTMINLTILNQKNITDFTLPSYSNISTLRLENVSSTINEIEILRAIPANARVRLIGLYYEAADAAEISGILDLLDGMRGLDENGNNVEKAQVSGTIHTSSLTGAEIASFNERYPYLTVAADHTSSVLRYYNGSTLVQEETILDGGDGTYTGTTPTKSQDAQYTYTFAGWSKDDDNTVDSDALTNVVADRNVYACYTGTLRKYNVYYVKASADGGGTLQTINNVDYGTVITAASSYTGATPTTSQGSAEDYPFEKWEPASATVQGDTTFTAKFGSPVEVKEITDTWDTIIANIDNGTYSTKYKIGNYKPLDLGTEGTINMQIVAMDADKLASGGTAPLTFIGMELLNTKYRMTNDTGSTGGWELCDMRNYLISTILPLVPSIVASRINIVKKYSSTRQNTGYVRNGFTYDKLWIPGIHEITGNSVNYESLGASYTNVYKNASSRIKNYQGSASYWWLRSLTNSWTWTRITNQGEDSAITGVVSSGIALGFCLGLEQES